MTDVVYVVTSSLFSQSGHSIDTRAFHSEEKCKEYFTKRYDEMVKMCKSHCNDMITFWEAYKKKEPLPEKGKYIFVSDLYSNDRTIELVEDGVTNTSYHITYAGMAIGE